VTKFKKIGRMLKAQGADESMADGSYTMDKVGE
jgi:hypothetical protein